MVGRIPELFGVRSFAFNAKLRNFADDGAESWEKVCRTQEIAVPLHHQPKYVNLHSQTDARGGITEGNTLVLPSLLFCLVPEPSARFIRFPL